MKKKLSARYSCFTTFTRVLKPTHTRHMFIYDMLKRWTTAAKAERSRITYEGVSVLKLASSWSYLSGTKPSV